MLEKGRREHNSVEAKEVAQEIADLQQQVNEAQYGLGEIDERGKELVTGEQREINRIENESIPQLQKLLDDLKAQLESQLDNPLVKYGLTSAVDRGEAAPIGVRNEMDPNGYPVQFKSAERDLY